MKRQENEIASIILNYNNYQDTIKCVDNLINLKVRTEIVVVDNASNNESFSILQSRYANIENCHVLLSDKNRGYSAGNNVGMRYLTEEYPNIQYYTIMNPDTFFEDSKLLEKLKDKLEKNEQIAVIAPVMWMFGKCYMNKSAWNLPSTFDYLRRQMITIRSVEEKSFPTTEGDIFMTDVVHGSFFMIKAALIQQMGFLDEEIFMYGEENLLAIKLKKMGYREAIDIHSKFEHNHPRTTTNKSLVEEIYGLYRGGYKSSRYVWKVYYPKALIFLVDIVFFTNTILLTFFHIRRKILKFLK